MSGVVSVSQSRHCKREAWRELRGNRSARREEPKDEVAGGMSGNGNLEILIEYLRRCPRERRDEVLTITYNYTRRDN